MDTDVDLKQEQRRAQMGKALALMLESGATQAEAAEAAGMSLATFKRWLPDFQDLLLEVSAYARQQYLAGMIRAAQVFPQAVEQIVAMATGEHGDARDRPKAYDRLLALVREMAQLSPAPEKAPEEFSPSFQPLQGAQTMVVHFGGAKVEIQQGAAPTIIEAQALPDHSES